MADTAGGLTLPAGRPAASILLTEEESDALREAVEQIESLLESSGDEYARDTQKIIDCLRSIQRRVRIVKEPRREKAPQLAQ